MGLALDCQASGTPSGSGRQRGWGHRPLPTGLWSSSMGGATSQLLCQMAFDSNIDVNGIWIMTLFVSGTLLLFITVQSWREIFHLVTFV